MSTRGYTERASVWAVKCGAYVEFRLFREPPSVKFSKLIRTRTVEHAHFSYINEPPYYVKKMIPKKVKTVLAQASFIGGRLVCYGQHWKVMNRLKLRVSDGRAIQLSTEQAKNVLSRKWREDNL